MLALPPLLTDAASGIGRAIAEELVRRGTPQLAIVARDAAELDRTAAELRAADAEVLPIARDLAEPDAAAAIRAWVDDASMTVDLLVNNAGVGSAGPFAGNQDGVDAANVVAVNVTAVVALTEAYPSELKGQVQMEGGGPRSGGDPWQGAGASLVSMRSAGRRGASRCESRYHGTFVTGRTAAAQAEHNAQSSAASPDDASPSAPEMVTPKQMAPKQMAPNGLPVLAATVRTSALEHRITMHDAASGARRNRSMARGRACAISPLLVVRVPFCRGGGARGADRSRRK